MIKKILFAAIAIMYTCISLISVGAQEYQDFINDWFVAFPQLANPQNTGLTVLPILEISPGGERSNLGNAYTAVARDISFFESNPAASSLIENTELAFFHRNLISDVSMDSVMYSRRANNLGYGFAGKFLHFEFTSVDGIGNQLASANPSEILLAGNLSYNLFDNYYVTGLAAGMNLKIAFRNIPYRLYDLPHINLPANSQNLFAIMADVGLLSRFNFAKFYSARDKNFSIGLSGKNLGPAVRGEALPSEVSAGLAYRPLRFFMITGDINYMMNFLNFSNSEGLGFAVGLDLRFAEFFSLQSGFEFRGGNPRISLGSDIDLNPIGFQVNYTLDQTTSSNSPDNFSVTAKLNFGDEGRADLQRRVDEIYIQALIALSDGDYDLVIQLCDEIVDREYGLDPSFTPAWRTRNLAVASKAVNEDFENFGQQTEISESESSSEEVQ